MNTLAWMLILTGQTGYGDYISDPRPLCRPNPEPSRKQEKSKPASPAPGSSPLTSPEPAPLPASPPPSSPRREAGRRIRAEELSVVSSQLSVGGAAVDGRRSSRFRQPTSDNRQPRQWYSLTSHPGYEGFGARNARGEVVVEWHRRVGSNVLEPGPVPDAAASSCPNGQCPAPAYSVRRRFAGSR